MIYFPECALEIGHFYEAFKGRLELDSRRGAGDVWDWREGQTQISMPNSIQEREREKGGAFTGAQTAKLIVAARTDDMNFTILTFPARSEN